MEAVLRSQYHAALEMLRRAIDACPQEMWHAEQDKNKFWHIAYHTLFYTHLYLASEEASFRPYTKHQEKYAFAGSLPWAPHEEPAITEPYDKADLLEYHDFVQAEVDRQLPALDLTSAQSGFHWLPFGKLELMLYNIRHIQQHTGELCERLGTRAQLDVDWVGRG